MTAEMLAIRVLQQCNLDTDDLQEYGEQIIAYLNDGYERLYHKWYDRYMPEEKRFMSFSDSPDLPKRMHLAIADWATWLMYRNGNVSKQNRGVAFKIAFEDFLSSVPRGGGIEGEEELSARAKSMRFRNLYRS